MQAPVLAAAILAAAVFAPNAPGAPSAESGPRTANPELGRAIARQGNLALAAIRADNRRAVRQMALPALPDYAEQPASLQRVARTARKDGNS